MTCNALTTILGRHNIHRNEAVSTILDYLLRIQNFLWGGAQICYCPKSPPPPLKILLCDMLQSTNKEICLISSTILSPSIPCSSMNNEHRRMKKNEQNYLRCRDLARSTSDASVARSDVSQARSSFAAALSNVADKVWQKVYINYNYLS